MLIKKLKNEDVVYRTHKSIFIKFNDKRKVISTAHLNGGYREDLESAFNFDSKPEKSKNYCNRSDTYEEELKLVAKELGLNPEKTAGISTAVSMKNAAIKTASYEDLHVTAIVTAGISVNGTRVGDPSSFCEREGKIVILTPGTINIILSISADMPPGTLARTLVTCTEAKTAAVQELLAKSMYSRGLATGSGTDETIVICSSDSKLKLKFAGTHSKVGELIGIAVMEAVKESLKLETGLSSDSQHSVLKRLDRFGVCEDNIWKEYSKLKMQTFEKDEFIERLAILDAKPDLVVLSSLYAHLLDQLDWSLLSPEEVSKEAESILKKISKSFGTVNNFEIDAKSVERVSSSMAENFIKLIVEILRLDIRQ